MRLGLKGQLLILQPMHCSPARGDDVCQSGPLQSDKGHSEAAQHDNHPSMRNVMDVVIKKHRNDVRPLAEFEVARARVMQNDALAAAAEWGVFFS